MPGIARKVIICAAVDGLIVQPLSSKGQRPAPPIQISYGDASISTASRDQIPDVSKSCSSFEAFGVVGLITVSRLSFLITITRRQQVAQVCGFPIYVVTEVAITPCATQKEAEEAVSRTSAQLQKRGEDAEAEDSDSEDDASLHASAIDEVDDAAGEDESRRSSTADRRKSTVAEDVISRKGSYGRFANRWFSKISLPTQTPRVSTDEPVAESTAAKVLRKEEDDDAEARTSSLLPKLLRTTQVLFGSSRSFYFSYDWDITRSWADRIHAQHKGLPLHQQVNPRFFWNQYISQPLIASGHDALVLPLMQGFVGQRQFVMDCSPPQADGDSKESVEMKSFPDPTSAPSSPRPDGDRSSLDLRPSEKKYLVTVISRRSTKRAGLRYLRRGIDDEGHVANAVETEQLLSQSNWGGSKRIYSFVQIRGSIPLFFTQSPYSLKPAPVVQHSAEANYDAAKRHFERLTKEYGALQIINLVEKHNVEASIGNEYQKTIQKLNEDVFSVGDAQVRFEWFDFHAACRGMKFENVSLLLDTMRDKLEEFGSTIEEEGYIRVRQGGVLRTNCMDCLDRTNVCQSSFAKHVLDNQLREEGYDVSVQQDQETTWFNTLWADNGDAISKQYASTAAMKGDYTRTKQRNYKGQLNDIGLSLTRFYNGMVNDYFSQAAIDFLLGNVSSVVFEEFEAEMMTKDPAMSVLRMRDQAIELCQKRVISNQNEDLVGGWVLLSPPTSDTIRSPLPFEEVVLLLTNAALYLCRFNWKLDKVSSFERVDIDHIVGIKFGTYITSAISPAYTDEAKNVGFVVSYQPGKTDIRRINTRTLSSTFVKQEDTTTEQRTASSSVGSEQQPTGFGSFFGVSGQAKAPSPPIKKIAFKAPYSQSSAAMTGERGPRMSELQQVVTICADVERLALEARSGKRSPATQSIIEKEDIISLEEARQSTSLLDYLSHSIKKLVWAT